MKEQEYKITCDGHETFYFQHSLTTAAEHAMKAFEEKIKTHDMVELYKRNTSVYSKDTWILIKAKQQYCVSCGSPNVLVDCEYRKRGLGGRCLDCCEICHSTEPFPCREYDKRKAGVK